MGRSCRMGRRLWPIGFQPGVKAATCRLVSARRGHLANAAQHVLPAAAHRVEGEVVLWRAEAGVDKTQSGAALHWRQGPADGAVEPATVCAVLVGAALP